MPAAEPYFREAGAGPGVVCLHSNASTSGQWRDLIDVLATSRHVLAPDCYGSGRSPDWPSDRIITLRDEAAFLEPVLDRAGAPFALVGHSYGAAIALRIALDDPSRVDRLVLYEPTLFNLVDQQGPPPNGADGIRNAVESAGAALDAGDRDAAAAHFIDFWMGPGSWAATPPERKPAIAGSVVNVRRWRHAVLTEWIPPDAFRALDIPVLYMLGERSPEPAQAVARVLVPLLPRVRLLCFEGLGHMAPITHAQTVNAEIARALLGA